MNIRKKLAYLFYGTEIRILTDQIKLNKLKYKSELKSSNYMHSKFKKENEAYLKAKGMNLAYTEQNKCLLKSVEDDNNKYAKLEDKYFKISNEKSKEILLLESELIQYNNIFLKTAPTIQGQGESEPITTTIGKNLKEFGLYPLFHKYSFSDLSNYFNLIQHKQTQNHLLINFAYLYAHKEKIKEEERWSSVKYTENKANKILKDINETR